MMKCPLIPMASMTGKPTREIIFDYLKSLKDNSIDSIMAYPRSGCELEYLSREWFETVGNYVECASELDMSVWLYDDFNWPSGRAGGIVTGIEPLRLKRIIYKGENVGRVEICSQDESLFDEYHFPDLLSHEATDLFIKSTHEEYYKRFGKYFGNVIVGFFTDEPAVTYGCDENSLPYYNGMEDDYQKVFSRSFSEDLKNGYEYLKRNVMSLAGDRFSECYTKKIANWCTEHGVLFTGHLMHDDAPYPAMSMNGRFLKNLKNLTVPGIDNIFTEPGGENILALLGAAEYAAGENGAMAELFALGPCDMSYALKRAMIYFAASFKISRYVLAVSHLDMRGNLKIRDYFHDFSATSPDFSGMRLLSKDAKLASELAGKDFKPDVYIRYPSTACMDNFGVQMDMKPFRVLVNALSLHQIQWKYLDEGESPSDAPIIEFSDGLDEYIFGDVRTRNALDIVCHMNVTPLVTGDGAKDIFVRRYEDGTVLILNRTDGKKTVYYNGESLVLYGFGVFVSAVKHESLGGERVALSECFDVEYKGDNVARCMFVNDAKSFEVSAVEPVLVSLAVRCGCDALVCDKLVDVYGADGRLPKGMNALYKLSKPFELKKGKSVIKSGNDLKYLPSVLIFGDFSYKISSGEICSVALSKRARSYKTGDKFTDYGEVAFKKTLTVPSGAKYLELSDTELYTKVFVNDGFLGEKICAPYIFNIEKYASETVELKIVQYSTQSSPFGDVEYFNEHHDKIAWRNTPSPKPCELGFKADWVMK